MIHEIITPQKNGVVRFPPRLRAALHLDQPGAQLEVEEVAPGEFLLRGRISIPADQAWFWTRRWQQMEREADADLAAGRYTDYESVEEFLTDIGE